MKLAIVLAIRANALNPLVIFIIMNKLWNKLLLYSAVSVPVRVHYWERSDEEPKCPNLNLFA
jgi:hypothetical protein